MIRKKLLFTDLSIFPNLRQCLPSLSRPRRRRRGWKGRRHELPGVPHPYPSCPDEIPPRVAYRRKWRRRATPTLPRVPPVRHSFATLPPLPHNVRAGRCWSPPRGHEHDGRAGCRALQSSAAARTSAAPAAIELTAALLGTRAPRIWLWQPGHHATRHTVDARRSTGAARRRVSGPKLVSSLRPTGMVAWHRMMDVVLDVVPSA